VVTVTVEREEQGKPGNLQRCKGDFGVEVAWRKFKPEVLHPISVENDATWTR
jgi:hypothetical protein